VLGHVPPALPLIKFSRNRLLAKQQLWAPNGDDNYDTPDVHTPALVPVFDPAFALNAAPIDNTPINIVADTMEQATPLTPHHNHAGNDRVSPCIQLPDIGMDLEAADFREWKSWSAPRRIAAIRRWIIHAAHKYGPVEHWADDFSEQWSGLRLADAPAVDGWLHGVRQRIKMGLSALSYLCRAGHGG
jgi:hypothetical protein